MGLPAKLKNFGIFNDAESYIGQAAEVTIPKLGRKLESFRGAGMNGPVKVDLGMSDDGIQFEFKIGGLDLLSIRQYANASVSGVQLRFAGAYQRDDTGEVDAVEIVARGRHEEIDFGTQKPGDDTEQTIVMPCAYYKLTVNGVVVAEIDIMGMKENIGGKDRLAAQRKACGY